eukprot:m.119956 g.119956  ORF g.119956 m.119956 type:complete len:842 (-) comp14340_c1_seq4:3016-5541(-)
MSIYRALYDFKSDDPDDLQFSANDLIRVIDFGEGEDSWWEGELNGQKGSFPSNYVTQMKVALTLDGFEHITGGDSDAPPPVPDEMPPDTEDDEEEELLAPPPHPAAAPTVESVTTTPIKKEKRNVKISLENNIIHEVFSRFEYDRRSPMVDMSAAMNQWMYEEEEEKLRMLLDRWDVLERSLPPGQKCQERLDYEREEKEALEAARKAEEEKQERRRQSAARLAAARAAAKKAKEEKEEQNVERPPPQPEPETESEPDEDLPHIEVGTINYEDDEMMMINGGEVTDRESSEEEEELEPPPRPPKTQDEPVDEIERAIIEFTNFTKSLHENGGAGFSIGYENLDMIDMQQFSADKCRVGQLPSNRSCNRYTDIVPYDSYRVVLNGEKGDDYINASMLKGLLPGAPDFVASQGPKANTIDHFWKMVYQLRSRMIIMVTNCVEGTRTKCETYWPSVGKSIEYDADDRGNALRITALSEKSTEQWAERTFLVTDLDEDKSLEVTQLQFMDWPDHGVPQSNASFLSFLHRSMAIQQQNRAKDETGDSPIVVHCSAGVGRSGVYIAVYSILTSLPFINTENPHIELDSLIISMRKSRRYMVQTVQQYVFCYEAIVAGFEIFLDAMRKSSDPILGTMSFKDRRISSKETAASSTPDSPLTNTIKNLVDEQLAKSLAREANYIKELQDLREAMSKLMTTVSQNGGQSSQEANQKAQQAEARAEAAERDLATAKRSSEVVIAALETRLKKTDEELETLKEKNSFLVGELKQSQLHVADVEMELEELKDSMEATSAPNDTITITGGTAVVSGGAAPAVPEPCTESSDAEEELEAPAAAVTLDEDSQGESEL